MKFSFISFLLFSLSIISCVKKSKEKNELKDRNLYGRVKSVCDTTYKVEGKIEYVGKNQIPVESFYLKFNNDGFIIEEGKFGEGSNYVSHIKISENSIKIEETVTGYNEKGEIDMLLTNYYENGKLHDANSRHPLDSQHLSDGKSMYRYDEKGNLIEFLNYSYDGTLYQKTEYKYNTKDQLIEELKYENKARSLSTKDTYEYDTKGNKILSHAYDYGKFVSIKKDNGNDTIITQYGNSGRLVFYFAYKYDDSRNLIESISYSPDGSLFSTEKRKYDNWGNMIESRTNSYLGEIQLYIQKFSYEYDAHHNWIKQIEFNEEKAIKITNRKIVYFD